jgi:D-sedoheptulose 7-phosphate isomerase
MKWLNNVEKLNQQLCGVAVSDFVGKVLDIDQAYGELTDLSNELRQTKNTIYCIGNGASASMASHFSADMAKTGRLHTQVFSDLALITAISNDMGYEEVFSEPLRRRSIAGDLLLAISSSGRSKNILQCVTIAKEIGLTVITVSGMATDNPLRRMGDINFYCPAESYGDIETVHAAILHHWIDCVVLN